MSEHLHLFENDLVDIEIKTNKNETFEFTYPLGYVAKKMLNELYLEYPNWSEIKAKWNKWGTPIGLLKNNEFAKTLKDRIINKNDWIYYCEEDHKLIAYVYFKNNAKHIELKIKKSDLVNNFISRLNSLFGNNWTKFDTFFLDTGNPAYTFFENTYHRRKNPRIPPSTLAAYILSNALNKEKASKYFYLLYFQNLPFFKIGYTSNFKFRLYNFLYPNSIYEKELYEGNIINFSKSFVIKTDDARPLEKSLKSHLKEYIYKNNLKSKEVFQIKALNRVDKLITYEKRINLESAIGIKDSRELKEFLQIFEVPKKALTFYSKGNTNLYFNLDL